MKLIGLINYSFVMIAIVKYAINIRARIFFLRRKYLSFFHNERIRDSPAGAISRLHPLRAVPARLPDVYRAWDGNGLAARAGVSDARVGGRKNRHDRGVRIAHRLMPCMPRLRDRLPQWRAFWRLDGIRPRPPRASQALDCEKISSLRTVASFGVAHDGNGVAIYTADGSDGAGGKITRYSGVPGVACATHTAGAGAAPV